MKAMLGWICGALLCVHGAAAADEMLTPVQVVQLAQSALVVLGEDPGPVDGAMGPQTRAAITAYNEASGLEMGWDGANLNQGQAWTLNVAAGPALERAFGHRLDGNYGYIGVFPMSHGAALVSGDLDGVDGGVDCAAATAQAARINGLVVFDADSNAAIVTSTPPVMNPLPRTGAWHPEAEPWQLLIVNPDVISFQQEGDHYVYGRCRQ